MIMPSVKGSAIPLIFLSILFTILCLHLDCRYRHHPDNEYGDGLFEVRFLSINLL